eukprot:3686579-Pleurochrysis_carterae.AAC.2
MLSKAPEKRRRRAARSPQKGQKSDAERTEKCREKARKVPRKGQKSAAERPENAAERPEKCRRRAEKSLQREHLGERANAVRGPQLLRIAEQLGMHAIARN